MNVPNVITNGKTVISLFAGCGGSSLGYKYSGYKELLAIDFDRNAIETFKLNFPEVPIWQKDIRQVTSKEILDFCNLKVGELDILDGSPPCQGFSTAGKRNVNDSRNDLFLEYVRLVKELKPKVFVMENVSGMIKGKMKGKYIEIIKTLKELNYNVKSAVLNSMYYGVPQSRQRLIFIGIRKDFNITPSFPLSKTKPINVEIALKNIDLTNDEKLIYSNKNEQDLILKLQEGQQMSKIHPKGWGFNLIKIDRNKPCPTITKTFRQSQTGLLHYNENRFLTISELKRLSSFPDDFKFIGKFEEQWARIGNAVMPMFMYYISSHIALIMQWQGKIEEFK